MNKKYVSMLLLMVFSFQISLVANSVEITLTSSMANITADTYKINKNIVTLTSNEEYIIKGTCSECGIEVKKGTSPTITLSSIKIDNSLTGPFVIKKSVNAKLILEGISTIIDKETDENLDDFEGAGIKFKSGSNLTIDGTGTLIVLGNIKNGIKGASASNLVINGGIFNVTCVNNAIAADGSVIINGGTFNIETSEGDGIKSDPDYGDSESEGSLIINDGNFNINSFSDGIQSKAKLIINGGIFNIKTFKDGSSSNFNKDLYSAKGIKVSTNETDQISLLITGGTFNLNTADDALHSDGNLTITGGKFQISSGDDAIHADQYLILGKTGDNDNLININISKSLEGIEGSQVYIYSGIYRVLASDDGINAAGDTTDQCGQNGMNNRNFGPGNQQGGNMNPMGNMRRNLRGGNKRNLQQQSQCNNFHIYISGGDIYVNAGADGLDANGNIVISEGNLEIWGAKTGSDGDFIDLEGTMSISGCTLFLGGNAGMVNPANWKNSQNKIYGQNSVNSNGVISIMSGSNYIKNYTAPKNIGYLYYTSPYVDSTYKFSISGSSGSSNQGYDGQQKPGSNNGNNNNMPFQNNNGTMPPGNGNNMPFPNNNGTMPPGNGNNMPFPNNNGTMPPGNDNNMPFPNNNGTMPPGPNPGNDNNMPFPNNNGTMPPGPNPGNDNNMPFPNNNGTMPPGPNPGNDNNITFPQNNGTMPPGPNPGNDNNNDPKPEEDNDDSPIDENEFAIYKAKGFYLNIGNLYLIILSMILLEL